MITVKVWDVATRLFHWALVLCILGAWLTIEYNRIELHEIFGHALFVLLFFRVIWGFAGSSTSLFKHFMVRPDKALTYLKNSLKHNTAQTLGHNPAGGWMVLCLVIVLSFQVLSGLLANNDLGFSGVLSDQVSKSASDTFTQLHAINFNILLALVWLHLVAVFFYVLVKRENLVSAMVNGNKLIHPGTMQNGQSVENIKSELYFSSVLRATICFTIALTAGGLLYLF